MNSQERDALRAKHRQGRDKFCLWCMQYYPCDIIWVLDAWEAELKAIRKLAEEVTAEEYGPAYAQGYRVALQDAYGDDWEATL